VGNALSCRIQRASGRVRCHPPGFDSRAAKRLAATAISGGSLTLSLMPVSGDVGLLASHSMTDRVRENERRAADMCGRVASDDP
jgi:hypothetical protein